ncbi:hypothetical protein A3K73_09300 [Candidatus Pacearchaeota archaeon RBG_13_36_9]|nr:MAG: hypothetical protein A3K73_09300 [Candidatus Pacearchaeota archaeon RBG_13_36_9]
MITYKVETSPEFQKQFYKLDRVLQERVRKILDSLPFRNWKQDALAGDLKGFYSHHFEDNHYRIIYTVQDYILKILAIWVGKRKENFYKDLRNYLKRTKQLK